MMDKIVIGMVSVIGVAVLLFFVCLLATFFGGVAGWAVGIAFPYVLDTVREISGMTELTDFQIGAVFGFVGSFLKSSNYNSKS